VELIAEYLERALKFERFADLEDNPQRKADLQKQAAAYRKLAVDRSKKLGITPPPGAGI
jgi:predicted ATPase with chaperone activity